MTEDKKSFKDLTISEYCKQTKLKIKREKFALTKVMRKELLSNLRNKRYRIMIRLMLETGLRVKELVNLAIYMVRLIGEPMIKIEAHGKTKYLDPFNPKSYESNRPLPITSEMARILQEDIIKRRKKGYVFPSQKTGKALNTTTIIKEVNRAAKKCKTIPLHIDGQGNLTKNIGSHTLRRTYASYLAHKKNFPIGKISKRLGHADIRTTFIYLFQIEDYNFDRDREVMQDMNE